MAAWSPAVANRYHTGPTDSPSRGGDVIVCERHKPTELALLPLFNSVLVSVSVSVALYLDTTLSYPCRSFCLEFSAS